MKKLIILLITFGAICYLISTTAKAQTLVWKGTVNNDFFNENNWQDSSTLTQPGQGTLEPGVAIGRILFITNVTNKIIANGTINMGGVFLHISSAHLKGTAIQNASQLTLSDRAYLDLSSSEPLINVSYINLADGLSWLRTLNYNHNEIVANLLDVIKINTENAVYKTNLRLDNYYLNGCVIRGILPSTIPLKTFTGINLTETVDSFIVDTIYKEGEYLPAVDVNNIESFVLRKGYMVTFATNADGTGKSKVYIASEEDLVINKLPLALQNSISFIRVLPWNWVNKKGVTGADYVLLDAQWRYDWGDNVNSTTSRNLEFVPMSWMSTGTQPTRIATRIAAYGTTHIMSFNEPDSANQSGQYDNFTDFNASVPFHKKLMQIGCRIVSPGCLEDGVFGYLANFNTLARSTDVRMDAISIHWSDWGNYTTGEGTVTGLQIFNRFKVHLKKVYDTFGLPIWITEFNANPNRSAAVQAEFMTLALPYLESLDYVERYNWFQSANGNSDLYFGKVAANGLTPLGTIYRNQISTPSIPERIVNERNNLNLKQ